MLDKILVVCVGNICRSPIGERLLKKYIPNKTIASAGISALVGREADSKAVQVAASNHLSLEKHCAQQLSKELCKSYDLILVMQKDHINAVCELVPEARGKTMLFGHWNSQEIYDPYQKSIGAFEATYLLIDAAAQQWASKLK